VLWVLFCLEFVSPGFFANGTISQSTRHVPPLLKIAPDAEAKAAKLSSPAETGRRFVPERYGEPTPRPGDFFTAQKRPRLSHQGFIVLPLFFRIILAPKVPRYISNSVLNI
jgi:hypothetical protein